jgi:pyridoxine 5-phosphate synthase
VFETYRRAAVAAAAVGLGVNAGHDLDLTNLRHFAHGIPGLLEVSVGHALVSDALFMGLDAAVRAYLAALS